jgi:hypothetical protein
MSNESYKYSLEYRERFGFNGAEIYWMEECFKLFSEKAAKEIEEAESDGKRLIYTKEFFPMMFEDILFKAKQWSVPPKTWSEDE